MKVRKLTGSLIVAGGIALGVTGLTPHSASAVQVCFPGLTTGFTSPDKTSTVSFVQNGTGLDFSTNSGVRVLSITLHLAGGATASFTYPGGVTSGTDVHATPRATIASYDICKDEAPFTTTTTAATTTTTTPATTTTTAAATTTTGAATTTTVPVSTSAPSGPTTAPSTAPTTVAPTTQPSVLPTTVVASTTTHPPTLPATGQGLGTTTILAVGSLLTGGALLLVSRRPASR